MATKTVSFTVEKLGSPAAQQPEWPRPGPWYTLSSQGWWASPRSSWPPSMTRWPLFSLCLTFGGRLMPKILNPSYYPSGFASLLQGWLSWLRGVVLMTRPMSGSFRH